jgi:metal-responsive CopG/Arc/MetJ family transcriptional regulator
MRTVVDIPDEDLRLLNQLTETLGLSRAEIVRQAIAQYLAPHRMADAFRLWRDVAVDGLVYQESVRQEW